MASLDYKKLVAQELKRRDSTFPPWYFDIPEAPENILDVTELPEKVGVLSAKEMEITHTDGYGVVEAIRNKKWSCVEVIEAFCKRALLAQKYVFSISIGTNTRPIV
jgi:amidase